MAERILYGITERIIVQLYKDAVKEVGLLWGVEDELGQLENTISVIKGVLVDAEQKQLGQEQIKIWLSRLEDVVYEADDLVDEFSTEALQRQVLNRNTMAKKVRDFFSSSRWFVFQHKMGKKIKDVRKKLDAINEDRKFHLEICLHETTPRVTRSANNFIFCEEYIIGRIHEKTEIINLLFDVKTEENNGVITIVGAGGLGKTTLARLVTEDEDVRNHFELIMWANVPRVFEVESIVKEIVILEGKHDEGSAENTLRKIQERVNGKRYLLVLDDVWDLNRDEWLKLETLRQVADGSKVIITTRDQMAARVINGPKDSSYRLGTLDEEKSWSLFKKLAFEKGQEPDDPRIVETGKEIMKKCGGIPLVIRTMANMFWTLPHEEWLPLKDRELSKIDPQKYDESIILTLKLSYDHLPSRLKQCFAYCSLFPKNHIMDVKKLINHWMAQGFIDSSSTQDSCLEDIGYQYFKALLYRSFFEVVEIDDNLNVTKCKMHDFMHDLALSVAGTKSLTLNLNEEGIDERTLHVALKSGWTRKSGWRSIEELSSSLAKAERIRTFLNFPTDCSWPLGWKESILKCKSLRTLDLHNARLHTIPSSVGKLKHLRHLDISSNSIDALPDSIMMLQNLQTLNLSKCEFLQALPKDITRLVNLRHLYIEDCTGLTHMPRGICGLTNLQTLSLFQFKRWCAPFDLKHVGNLNELGNLNSLRGHLKVNIEKDTIECKGANLRNKQYLQSLELHLEGGKVDACEDLMPHPNLKELSLKGSGISVALLNCVTSLTSLTKLVLEGLGSQFLEGLNHLSNLKVLDISGLWALEYITKDDIVYESSPVFPSLQQLRLTKLPNLKGWWNVEDDLEYFFSASLSSYYENWHSIMRQRRYRKMMGIPEVKAKSENTARKLPFFPCLSQLSITECPNLISMPLFPFLQEKLELSCTNIKPFRETLMMNIIDSSFSSLPLSKLKTLCIRRIHDLQHFPEGFTNLTSLMDLRIFNCSMLKSLSPGFHHLISLRSLYIWWCEELDMPNGDDAILWKHLARLSFLSLLCLPKLVSVPQGLQQVNSLTYISISGCEKLEIILPNISNIKSLTCLHIDGCPELKSLPEGINCLSLLQSLSIGNCPFLLDRCQENTGDYWPLIRHIKNLTLKKDVKQISATSSSEEDDK